MVKTKQMEIEPEINYDYRLKIMNKFSINVKWNIHNFIKNRAMSEHISDLIMPLQKEET